MEKEAQHKIIPRTFSKVHPSAELY